MKLMVPKLLGGLLVLAAAFLATVLFVLPGCGTIDSAGGRIDASVDHATERLTAVMDCATTRATGMLEQAAGKAQEVTTAAVVKAGAEARATLDHATVRLEAATDRLLVKVFAETRTLVMDIIKAVATELLDKINRWSNRTLERLETRTLPAATAQTKNILDALAGWWDKIVMGILTLGSGLAWIRARRDANLKKDALGTVVEGVKRANGSGAELKRAIEAILKERHAPKQEYAIRHLIRKMGDGAK
jgi:hypothetical protein